MLGFCIDNWIGHLNSDYYRFKDSNNTSNIKLLEKTKSHVRAGVSEVNEKMAERKLVQVISQKDYDQNKAGFYAFTDSKDNGAHIGIYELNLSKKAPAILKDRWTDF